LDAAFLLAPQIDDFLNLSLVVVLEAVEFPEERFLHLCVVEAGIFIEQILCSDSEYPGNVDQLLGGRFALRTVLKLPQVALA
jgi:hypothetical protein